MNISQCQKLSYRRSHARQGFGNQYSRVYEHGYYHHQWQDVERPIVRSLLLDERARGAKRTLDFACGTGRILELTETLFDQTTGIDVSESMLEVARKRCHQSSLLQQDITRQPLGERFDLVTAFRFFLNAEESLKHEALRAIHDALADDGVLIANVHQNARSPLGMAHRIRNRLCGRQRSNDMRFDTFVNLLNDHGFEVVQQHWYSFLPRPGPLANNVIGPWLLPVERWCKRLRVPHWLCQAYLVVAVKR